jgi:hypothetical protein
MPRARRGEARAWLDTFLARLETDASIGIDACILWPFSTNGGDGGRYPQIKIDGSMVRVTRYIYERLSGHALAAGELVRHWCDTPLCVNPWHLELGSHADNMQDMCERGRQAAGERNGRARLTESDVREIRALAGDYHLRGSVSRLARSYGVSPRNIVGIISGQTWASVR